MSFLFPKPPSPPAVPAVPPTPKLVDTAAAARRERELLRRKKGIRAALMTPGGGRGVTGEPNIYRQNLKSAMGE